MALTIILALCFTTVFSQKISDQVKSLPDMPPLLSNWYSGYVNVSKTRSLHYVLVESENRPKEDPLIVWLASGPGMYEIFSGLGPYRNSADGKFEYNLDTLTKNANVLYIDSPAGLGYSYAQRKIDLHSNDF